MLRRRFLGLTLQSGLGALALPMLESVLGERAYAQAQSRVRFLGIYFPNGVAQEGRSMWWPKASAGDVLGDLSGSSLAALEPVKNDVVVLKGLAGVPKKAQNDHLMAICGFLTGACIANNMVKKHKPSIDQVIGAHFRSLGQPGMVVPNLSANPELDPASISGYNNVLKNGLAWDLNGNLLPHTSNLQNVFASLFGKTATPPRTPGNETAAPQQDLEKSLDKSLLDALKDERASLFKSVSDADRQTLDVYYDSLRTLEVRLSQSMNPASADAACSTGTTRTFPFVDDAQRLDQIGLHAELTTELLALAFQCGITNVATYMLGGEASACRYKDIGVDRQYHDEMSHAQPDTPGHVNLQKVDAFHAQLLARLVARFKQTPLAGGGNLLTQSVILFGGGMSRGHNHDRGYNGTFPLPLIVAGGAGGKLKGGRYLQNLKGRNSFELISTILGFYGLDPKFGDNTEGTLLPL